MADLSGIPSSILAYSGIIQTSVYQRATTSVLWSALKSAMAAEGIPLPLGGFAAVNRLRSLFTAQRRASDTLMSAGDNTAINAGMISQAINYQPTPGGIQQYQLRYEIQITDSSGNTRTQWVTHHNIIPSSMTVGQLRDEMQAESLTMQQYPGNGETISGIGRYVLLQVRG